jgi:hypothetical protein
VSDLAELNRLLADAPVLARALANLARGKPRTLDAYLVTVETDILVENTRTRAHCYFVGVDANGQLRTGAFIERICEHIIDFAMPRSKIREASESFDKTGSSQKWARLTREARDLFTDLAKTGEGGELILFVLAERFLQLPQIICKMSLKTSGRMHYHGADGVHASIDRDTGLLSLYWCESKMYEDPSRAISDCPESLAPYLREDTTRNAARDRDVKLLGTYVDLDNPGLEAALKAYLDPDDKAFNRVKYCGIAFVGFDSDSYPPGNQRAVADDIAAAVRRSVIEWRGHVGRRIVAERLQEFDLHFLCMPLPSVSEFRQRFLSELGLSNVAT